MVGEKSHPRIGVKVLLVVAQPQSVNVGSGIWKDGEMEIGAWWMGLGRGVLVISVS